MLRIAIPTFAALSIAFSAHADTVVTATIIDSSITQAQVEAAQVAWGEALVQISTDYKEGGIEKAKTTAKAVIEAAYGYNLGPVLFKPTLTVEPQTFRPTAEGALAYFVGNDPKFPADTGFALKGWTDVKIENSAIFISGETAKTIGKVHITNADGTVTSVDKTWGYQLDDAGNLRIVLHHSSLPYTGQ
ncbi:phosphoribosyl-AMP cyclohydrolase (plasmid) [Peteryoungia desertarenae]|uniref:Phosphoribosyl-AMP cyclohydrolase n=1 Tax=Peteryoungia desertarenae TaxID=1813451 RepID=A0ABX6QT28_9HYPH|nr:phosphoribosyl-AMP cyclohydrolase [Peteryoungia desertarenae]QLF71654.1 phosphoribosyl-AMP cyclohydrolase [Peteryoungia desertarenae]